MTEQKKYDSKASLKKSIDEMEASGVDKSTVEIYRGLSEILDNISESVPPGGYGRIWMKKLKKRFKPKSNYAMLTMWISLGTLLIAAATLYVMTR